MAVTFSFSRYPGLACARITVWHLSGFAIYVWESDESSGFLQVLKLGDNEKPAKSP